MLAPVFDHALKSFLSDLDRNNFSQEEIRLLARSAVETLATFLLPHGPQLPGRGHVRISVIMMAWT